MSVVVVGAVTEEDLNAKRNVKTSHRNCGPLGSSCSALTFREQMGENDVLTAVANHATGIR